MGGGLLFHAFGAYVKVLEDEFGWSRTELSLAFALQRVETGFLGPIHGWAVDRYGPRVIMVIGVVIFAGAMFAFSLIGSLLAFYVVFAFIAIGTSLSSMLSVSVAVVNWFRQRRALARGDVDGAAPVLPGGVWLDSGWRTTAWPPAHRLALVCRSESRRLARRLGRIAAAAAAAAAARPRCPR